MESRRSTDVHRDRVPALIASCKGNKECETDMKTILIRPNGRATFAALVFVLFLLVVFPSSLAAQEGAAAARGKAIFKDKCAACHTVGGGGLVGPDLAGVTARRDAQWLDRFIRQPDVMIREKDPIAIDLLAKYSNIAMPNLGIGESDAAALSAYLATNGEKDAQAAQSGAAASAQLEEEGLQPALPCSREARPFKTVGRSALPATPLRQFRVRAAAALAPTSPRLRRSMVV